MLIETVTTAKTAKILIALAFLLVFGGAGVAYKHSHGGLIHKPVYGCKVGG